MTIKGQSGREQVKKKILLHASDEKEHSISDFLRACRYAKNTVYKYLHELVNEDRFIETRLGRGKNAFKPRFSITPKGLQEAANILAKEEFATLVDGMSSEELKQRIFLYRLLLQLQTKDIKKLTDEVTMLLKETGGFVDDVYKDLPKNAELVASTEPAAERKRGKAWYRKTGGKVNVQTPRPRSPRKERRRKVRNDE